jgi:hypothetical protein
LGLGEFLLAKNMVDKNEFMGMAYRASNKKKNNLWPTARAGGLCGGSGNWAQLKNKCADIDEVRKMGAGNCGQLSADWVERLMGYPDSWTDIEKDDIDTVNRYPAAWQDGSWDTIPRLAVKQANRINRIKGLGNSIVPQVAAHLWGLIKNNFGGE